MSSIREQAEKITERFIGSGDNIEMRRARCARAIEQAIRKRDKRAVKIIEDHRQRDRLLKIPNP